MAMKKQMLLLALIGLTCFSFSQNIPMGDYKPEHESVRKTLTLKADSTFEYIDISDGSCFFWFDVSGKWKKEKDTLILCFKNMYDSTCNRELRFVIGYYSLDYSDTSDINVYTNWGSFIFPDAVRVITKAGLKYRSTYFLNYPTKVPYYEMKRYDCSNQKQ